MGRSRTFAEMSFTTVSVTDLESRIALYNSQDHCTPNEGTDKKCQDVGNLLCVVPVNIRGEFHSRYQLSCVLDHCTAALTGMPELV